MVEEGAGVMAVVADTKDDTVVTEGVTVTAAWVDGVAGATASDDGVTVTVPAGVEDEVHVAADEDTTSTLILDFCSR